MNILNTMDYIHHVRTWIIPQALRRAGILSEGWNPMLDVYEHKFLGYTYKTKSFFAVPDKPVEGTTAYALMKTDPLPFPKGPFLKEKSSRLGKTGQQQAQGFEVVFPRGHVRVFHSLDELKQHILTMRTATASYHQLVNSIRTGKNKVNTRTASRLLKKRTGLPLSQLACDPVSIMTIKSLKTGSVVTRTPLSFKVSEGCKAAMQEEFSYPIPSDMKTAISAPAAVLQPSAILH